MISLTHMASWSTRRKSFYTSILLLVIVVVVGIPAFLKFYNPATCSDGKMNGAETGVDCGGDCPRICSADYLSPLISWSRYQKIGEGIFNLAAYIENPNLEGGVRSVPYIFKVYDARGILIVERKGSTSIPAHKNVLVFESGVRTDERIPARVTFEFAQSPQWQKQITNYENLAIIDKEILNATTSPRLRAVFQNRGVAPFTSIDIGAALYDQNDNIIAFSKSHIDELTQNERSEVVFTWPLPLTADVARIEILPILPF